MHYKVIDYVFVKAAVQLIIILNSVIPIIFVLLLQTASDISTQAAVFRTYKNKHITGF